MSPLLFNLKINKNYLNIKNLNNEIFSKFYNSRISRNSQINKQSRSIIRAREDLQATRNRRLRK